MGQNGVELLEDRVDLDGHVLGVEHLAGAQRRRRRIRGSLELNRFRPEHRGRTDLDEGVVGHQLKAGGVDGQLQLGASVRGFPDGCDRADLRAVQLHARAGFISNPARSAITVIGAVSAKPPLNWAAAATTIPTMTRTATSPTTGRR